jgi:CO/xanthine dehydrogenase FAD-binding subunit
VASWRAAKVEQPHHEREAEEELMEEEQKRLEELMRLYGLEEKEARAAYHLGLAEELFEEISEEAYRRSGFASVRGVHA